MTDTDINMHDVLEQLETLLDRERRALLDGDLGQIGPLMADKLALIERLTGTTPAEAELILPLHLKLRRNQELFDHALAGIRNVAERLGALRQRSRPMDVYDAQGRRETLSQADDPHLEKRA